VERVARHNVELPVILEKCCVAIEKHDLCFQGIYRIDNMLQKEASLKERSDKSSFLDSETVPFLSFDVIPADMDSVNMNSEEWISVINNLLNVTNVLKMWF